MGGSDEHETETSVRTFSLSNPPQYGRLLFPRIWSRDPWPALQHEIGPGAGSTVQGQGKKKRVGLIAGRVWLDLALAPATQLWIFSISAVGTCDDEVQMNGNFLFCFEEVGNKPEMAQER